MSNRHANQSRLLDRLGIQVALTWVPGSTNIPAG